jgi:hypothetical protein
MEELDDESINKLLNDMALPTNETRNMSGHGDTTTVSGHEDTTSVSGHVDTASVSGDEDTTSVSGDEDTTSVSGDEDTTSVSGHEDTASVSGDDDTTTVPGHEDTTTVSGDEDTDSVSGHVDTATVSGHDDTTTVSGHDDTTTLSGHEDTTTVPGHEDTTTVSGDEDTASVYGQEISTSVYGHDDTASVYGQEISTSVYGHEDTASVYGQDISTTVPGHEDTTTLSGHEDTTTLSGHGDTTTVPGHEDNTTLSGHEDTATLAGHEDTTTLAGHEDTTTLSGHEDTTTLSGHEDTTTVPGHEDTTTLSDHGDTTTVSGNEKTTTLSAHEDTSAVPGHEDNTTLYGQNDTTIVSEPDSDYNSACPRKIVKQQLINSKDSVPKKTGKAAPANLSSSSDEGPLIHKYKHIKRRVHKNKEKRESQRLTDEPDINSSSDSYSPNSDDINSSDSEQSSVIHARDQKLKSDPIKSSWDEISRKRKGKTNEESGVKRKKHVKETKRVKPHTEKRHAEEGHQKHVKNTKRLKPNSERLHAEEGHQKHVKKTKGVKLNTERLHEEKGHQKQVKNTKRVKANTERLHEGAGHQEHVKKTKRVKPNTERPHDEAGHRLSQTDNQTSTLPADHDESLQGAIDRSMQEATWEQQMRSLHEHRLDVLLKSNGLNRIQVPGDGNCFFEAALYHLDVDNRMQLRDALCNHLEDNYGVYKEFLQSPDKEFETTDECRWRKYILQVEKLREDGQWSADIADILPKALADWTGRSVRLLRSKSGKPILDLQPTTEKTSAKKQPILLAHMSPPGLPEHYDICRREPRESVIDPNMPQQQEPNAQNLTQREETPEKDLSHQEHIANAVPDSNTPRKSARFMTPPKKQRFRKRKATPENWKKNVRKTLKLTGKEHLSAKGRTVSEKRVKPCDCSKCRHKCNDQISEDIRQNMFDSFWSLGSYERQKDFICARVQENKTRTYLDESDQPKDKRRKVHRVYSFEVDGQTHYVCKRFVMTTLSVGEAYIDHALSNKSDGIFTGTEMRGKHTPHNKTKAELKAKVKQHIESFPTVEGHYTRRESTRKYLGADLNITRMYQLYIEECKSKGVDTVTQAIYRKIFNEEYNLSFHKPKKDQCLVCTKYEEEKRKGAVTQDIQEAFDKHQKRKLRAREEKENDKLAAKGATNLHVATFDLQAVLYTPCTLVSQICYARKLNCYNLTCYNLSSKSGTCFLWSEVDAKKGSCEIGTCLTLHLQSLPQNIKHVVLYSDTCTGQNRNQFMAASLLHTVATHEHISTIDQHFLESGHTQMECDAMHSAIEFAKSKTSIYVPSQWDTVLQMARRKDPYTVVPLKYYDIWNFKEVAAQRLQNTKIDTNGKRVNWFQMRWIRYRRDDPDTLQFKYDYDEEEFHCLKLSGSRRGRSVAFEHELPRKYHAKQPISLAKKRDLVRLCTTGVIPSEYTEYYKTLPSSTTTTDVLPEPDADEEDEDSESD